MERLSTGVPGLDEILDGGLPRGMLVMVGGPPGAGKTVLAEQVLFHHARQGAHALFLTTLSEPHDKLLRHAEGFTWFDPNLIGTQIEYLSLYQTASSEGLEAVAALVVQLVRERGATLVALDAFRSLRLLADDELDVRRFVFQLGGQLSLLGVTTFLTGEYNYAAIDESVEFPVVDAILMLSHERQHRRRQRFLEVVKLRGSAFLDGTHTLRIDATGLSVYPRHTVLTRVTPYAMGEHRLSTGVAALDTMFGGGLIAHSATAIVGTPGVGKTLLGLQFLAEGARQGEAGLMVSLDESDPHLEQRAHLFGLAEPGDHFFDGERLRMRWEPAVELQPDVLAAHLRQEIAARPVRRVVLDGITNLEAALAPDELNDYTIALINYLRGQGVTSLLIQDLAEIADTRVSVANVTMAATTDGILLMRHVELNGRLERVLSVIKQRDSTLDPLLRRYAIDAHGLHIGDPIEGVEQVLTGIARVIGTRDAPDPVGG